ncbi:MAG TPA: tyrosine-type recombinase/integrase [Chthonomonadaceae bacterium]|nr:tyrosine-type recombinase/integrase [Chthonomonadaceae bacterium]
MQVTDLYPLLDEFLDYVKHERRLAQRTCYLFGGNLRDFVGWLQDNGYKPPTTDHLQKPILRRFVQSLSKEGLRPRTIKGHVYPLRSFCDYLIATGRLPDEENPAAGLQTPKLDAANRPLITDKEIAQLLEGADRIADEERSALVRAVLAVLAYSGLRRAELLDLKMADVDLEEGGLLVRHGKGDKSRRVYVCYECLKAIREYLSVRRATTHDYLFTYDSRRQLGEEGLRTLLKEARAAAGMRGATNILPHSLRHAFATRLLRNGAPLTDIQAALGHTSLQTTQLYLHTDEESQKQSAQLGSLAQERARREQQPVRRFRRFDSKR